MKSPQGTDPEIVRTEKAGNLGIILKDVLSLIDQSIAKTAEELRFDEPVDKQSLETADKANRGVTYKDREFMKSVNEKISKEFLAALENKFEELRQADRKGQRDSSGLAYTGTATIS